MPEWTTWPADEPIVRVHDSTFGATEPHPGPDGAHAHGLAWARTRFTHFRPTLTTGWIPTVYGASDDVTAIAEVVLRGRDLQPTSGRTVHLRETKLVGHVISTVAPTRPLHLIEVTDPDLISRGPACYATTVPAAAALHAAHPDADGLAWQSRQHSAGTAAVLWVDEPAGRARLRRHELRVVEPPVPVATGPGRRRILAAAEALDVMVVAR